MLMRDMFEKNEHNRECELGVEIVSYLYNEIEGQEKLAFEQHLAGCISCTTEFAAVSGVTSSVSEWKATAFDHLQTPTIEIPYHSPTESTRILSKLAGLFSFSPWPPVAAGFATIAVLFGIGFFIFNGQKPEVNVAGNESSHATTPPSTPMPAPSVNISTGNDPAPAKKDGPQNVVRETPSGDVRVVKVSEKRTQAIVSQPKPAVVDTPTPKRAVDKPSSQKAPSLNEYAENEDKTLRLTDIFEELDAKE